MALNLHRKPVAEQRLQGKLPKSWHVKGPWHNQSCMAMELLPERKELWEDCRACHSLFCGRGNWGVAAVHGYAGSQRKAQTLVSDFHIFLLIFLHLQPKGDVNIQYWNIGCCWKHCVRISGLVLLVFNLEMLPQLAISPGKLLLFSFTPDSGEIRRADYVIQLPFDQNHWHLCHFLVGRDITTASISIMLQPACQRIPPTREMFDIAKPGGTMGASVSLGFASALPSGNHFFFFFCLGGCCTGYLGFGR